MFKCKRLAGLSKLAMICVGLFVPMHADGFQSYQFPTTNVTATRYATPLSQVGNMVRVSNEELWQKTGIQSVTQALALVPGVTLTNAGGVTGIFIRGLPAQNTKIVFDGISLFDVTSPQGSWSFEDIAIEQLDKIEVLEGSKSALYGANAQIAMINFIPKTDQNYVEIRGGNNQHQIGAGFSKSFSDIEVYMSATQKEDTSQSILTGTSEIDKKEINNYHFSLKKVFGWGVAKVVYHKTMSLANLDETYSPDENLFGLDNPNFTVKTDLDLGKVSMELPVASSNIEIFSYQRSSLSRIAQGSVFDYNNSTAKGYSEEFEWTHKGNVQPGWEILVGASAYKEAEIDPNTTKLNTRFGYFLQNMWTFPICTFQAGIRQDNYFVSKNADSYNLGIAFPIPEWKSIFKSNMSQGFRAPTLFEQSGSEPPNLPERSFTKDLTWEYRPTKNIKTSITVFESLLDNEIIYTSLVYPNFKYSNSQGTRRTTGVVYALEWTQVLGVDYIQLNYLNEHAINTTGEIIVRIPEQQLSAAIGAHYNQIEWGATFLYTGQRTDVIYNNNGSKFYPTLANYSVISTKIAYNLDAQSQLYTTIQNLLNQQYETVIGYATPARSIQFGFRYHL